MTGFFDWPELDPSGKHFFTACPNCGRSVQDQRREAHRCDDAVLEIHHVSLLLEEFGPAAYIQRNCVPYGETPSQNDHLCMWKPFNRWCESKFGEFDQWYAERTRP